MIRQVTGMERYFSLERFFKVIPLLNEYLPVTLEVAILAVLLGSLAGIFVAFIRVYRIPVLNTFFRGYITLMRGTPFIILMMLVYYYLPYFSWKWFQVDMNTWDKIIFGGFSLSTVTIVFENIVKNHEVQK